MILPSPLEAGDDQPPAHALLFDDTELHEVDDDGEAEAVCVTVAAKVGCVLVDDTRLEGWIAGIVDHDERALLALYDATLSRVYGLVLRLVRRTQLARGSRRGGLFPGLAPGAALRPRTRPSTDLAAGHGPLACDRRHPA